MSKKKDKNEVTKVTEWKRPEATGKIPTKRSGHTLSLVESSVYLFGGCTAHASNGKPGTTNELFALDVSQLLGSLLKLAILDQTQVSIIVQYIPPPLEDQHTSCSQH